MKYKLLLCIMLVAFTGCKKNAEKILESSFNKCQSIKNGYYEMTKHLKLISKLDTIVISHKTHFTKKETDTVFNTLYKSSLSIKDLPNANLLYTGDEMIIYFDSTGILVAGIQDIRKTVIKNRAYSLFHPLVDKDPYPFLNSLNKAEIKYCGEEIINGASCYHITANINIQNTTDIYLSGLQYEYWIKKDDYIPIQLVITKTMTMGDHTQTQYEKYILDKYELNNSQENIDYTIESIPPHIKLNNYRDDNVEPLKLGEQIPKLELKSTNQLPFNLADLDNKVVLLDFFYISCPPCISNLKYIKQIYNKYSQKGLKIIGIEPITSNIDNLNNFISKHGIEYPILMGDLKSIEPYKVPAYPTLYLVNKRGEIIFRHIGGLNENQTWKLEKIIDKAIKN